MAKNAEYSIVINGIKESISAVESLNKQLDALEQRMDKLASKNINVSTSGGDGGARVSALDEEAKMLQQIEQLHQKVAASEKQEYQELLHAKEELKEYQTIAKSIAAQTNLSQNINDTSTMMGMKAQLRDLKMAMQTVDVNGDQFKQWAAEANELTQKLKEAEASYGTFSRNVGNYSNGVVNGLKQIVIKVGETERTFASAREASRTLNNELKSLSVSGKRGTKEWNELNAAIRKFNNDVAGTSAGLNRVISALQGFTAVASVGRGLSSLFGIDNNEVNQSIQKLVALQGVLQGLQTIQQQLANNKGLGIVFNNAFGKIDQYNFALKRLIVSIAGTGTAARVAAAGVNLLSGAVKGLMSLGVMALITAAIEGISRLGKKIQEWAKGNADLVSSEKLLQNEIDATNEKLQKEIDLINKRYNAGQINAEQQRLETEKAYADAIGKSNEALQKQLELASKRGGNTSFANAALGNQSWVGDKGTSTIFGRSAIEKEIKNTEDLIQRWNLFREAVSKGEGIMKQADSTFGRIRLSASDVRDELNHLEQLVAGQLINSFRKFDITTEDGRKQFIRFVQNIQQNGNELQQSVLFRMGDILNQKSPDLANALNGYLGLVQQFVNNFNGEAEKLNMMNTVNSIIRSADPTIAMKERIKELENYLKEHRDELSIGQVADYNRAIEIEKKNIREYGQKKIKALQTVEKKEQDAIRQAEDIKNALRLRLMRDGLVKQLLQLDENNRKEIEKIKKNGKNVAELLALQEEATAKERLKIWEEYNDKIIEDTNQAELKAAGERVDKLTADIERISEASEIYFEPASAEDIWLAIFPSAKTIKEAKKMAKEMADTYGIAGMALDDFAKMKYGILEKYTAGDNFNDLLNGKFDNDMLVRSLEERFNIIDEYQDKEIKKINEKIAERYDIQKAALNDEKELALKELNDRTQEQLIGEDELAKLSKENGDYERALDANRKVYQEYLKEKEALQLEYSNREIELSKNTQDDIEKFNSIFYEQSLSALNDYMSKMNVMIDKQPQYTKLGFVDLKETRKQYDEVIKTAQRSLQYLRDIQQEMLGDKNISPKQRKALNKQISDQEKQLQSIINASSSGMESAKEKFRKQIMEIAEQVSQTAQQMISVFGDLYNYNIQKEMDALEDMNQKLEDKLNEQKEIEERHKNEIESIEDELANSRGDRRQQLIDQLNAEMQARREAAAEEKRIEAEKQANEHRLEILDKKKRMAQWKRDIASALISGAMAAANGYATKPFLPTGLAMGALATILTAAQVAIIKHNKPYAKGGLLEGPSHKHGGIPVGNTGIEVEGKEYVIRKESTAKNVNLLDFINKSKRKLTLSDFIDYYEGRKNKAFRNMSDKYADGGQLPTMPNIDLGDIMTDVAVVRDNRPVVVSVVDINRKQDDVRRVRTLAGL